MALSLKTGLISATVGTGVIGGSAGAYYALQKSPSISIEEQLKQDGKTLLNDVATARWDIKFNTYDKETKGKNLEITLATQDVAGLKQWCSENTKKEFNTENQKTYQAVKEICTVPTLREKFLKDKKGEVESTAWAAKLVDYKKNGTGEFVIPNIDKDNAQDENLIKNWCETEKDKEYTSETQKNYKASLKWCTKKGA